MKISEIREMLGKISPWPWCWSHFSEKANGYCVGNIMDEKTGEYMSGHIHDDTLLREDIEPFLLGTHETGLCNYNDPQFIAASPEIISALLSRLEEAEGVIEFVANAKWTASHHLEGADMARAYREKYGEGE